jgi:hypothetical protein
LQVETIKYSWDGSSQLPKAPTVPEKDDGMLEYISKTLTSGTLDQTFEEHLQEMDNNKTKDNLEEVRSSASDKENWKFLWNFTEHMINPL